MRFATSSQAVHHITNLLREHHATSDVACVSCDHWHHMDSDEVVWKVWVSAHNESYRAGTLDTAVALAEQAILRRAGVTPSVGITHDGAVA